MSNDFFSHFPWNHPQDYDFSAETEKKRISNVSFAFLLWIFLPAVLLNAVAIVSMVLGRFFPIVSAWTNSLMGVNVVNYILLYALTVPLSYLILRSVPVEKPEKRRLSFPAWLLYLVIAVGLMLIGSIIGNIVMAIPEIFFQINDPLQDFTAGVPLWFTALMMLIVAPLAEELLFRKFLIDRLHRYGTFTAVLISALFFAIFHQNLYQFFYAFLLGLLLGYLYDRHGRYLYCVLVHFSVNLICGVLPTVLQTFFVSPDSAEHVETFKQFMVLLGMALISVFQYLSAILSIILLVIFWRKWIILRRGSSEIPPVHWVSCVVLNPGMICTLIISVLLLGYSVLSMIFV